MGAYGMTPEVAEVLDRPAGRDDEKPLVATGGTLFGNPLQMASARATMEEVLTPEAYAHTQVLGGRLADGIEAVIAVGRTPVDDPSLLAAQRHHVRAARCRATPWRRTRTSTCRCAG